METKDWRDTYETARHEAEYQGRLLQQAIAKYRRTDPNGPLVEALNAIEEAMNAHRAMLDELRAHHQGADG